MMRVMPCGLALAVSIAAAGASAQESRMVEMQVPAAYAELVAGLVEAIRKHPREADFHSSNARGCTWEWKCDHVTSTEDWPYCDLQCHLPQ
jgi:hypothetical protein